jgi:hypothetical protein
LRETEWWKKFFSSRKRKRKRRRGKVLCLWKYRTHVLGMSLRKIYKEVKLTFQKRRS